MRVHIAAAVAAVEIVSVAMANSFAQAPMGKELVSTFNIDKVEEEARAAAIKAAEDELTKMWNEDSARTKAGDGTAKAATASEKTLEELATEMELVMSVLDREMRPNATPRSISRTSIVSPSLTLPVREQSRDSLSEPLNGVYHPEASINIPMSLPEPADDEDENAVDEDADPEDIISPCGKKLRSALICIDPEDIINPRLRPISTLKDPEDILSPHGTKAIQQTFLSLSPEVLMRCLAGMPDLGNPSKLGGKIWWNDYAPMLDAVDLLKIVRIASTTETAGFGDGPQ